MLGPMFQRFMRQRTCDDTPPGVKITIGSVVPDLELLRRQPSWPVDYMAGVIVVPVAVGDAPRRFHCRVEPRPGIGRLDMEGRGRDAMVNGPVHRTLEQPFGKTAIAEQMIVKELEMLTGQTIDLGQGLVHALGVKRTPAGEEGILVT